MYAAPYTIYISKFYSIITIFSTLFYMTSIIMHLSFEQENDRKKLLAELLKITSSLIVYILNRRLNKTEGLYRMLTAAFW